MWWMHLTFLGVVSFPSTCVNFLHFVEQQRQLEGTMWFFKILFYFIYSSVCVCLLHICKFCRSRKRSWGFPGARVTNSCELLCMVAEIWTLSFERAESPPLRHQAIPPSSNVFLAVYQVMVFRQLLYLGVQKTINWPVLTETQSRFLDSIFTNAIGIFLTINACPFTLPEFEIYIAPNKVWRKALGFPLLLFVMTHFLMSIQDNQDILSLWTPDWKWKQTGSASQKYPECLETTWLLEWIGVWFSQFVLHGVAWSFFPNHESMNIRYRMLLC